MSNENSVRPATPGGISWLYRRGIELPHQLVKHAKNLLIYTSLYLVLIAMAEVGTVMFTLSLPLNLAPVVLGLVAFAVYTGDRIADAEIDAESNPGQSSFVQQHTSLLSVLTALAYGLALALSVLGGPTALLITLLPGAFWVLYASDWVPEAGTYVKRLKEVLVVNSSMVALAWAVSAVFLPLSFAGHSVTPAVIVLFGYFFLDTFINTEIPNVRDKETDAAVGVSTLPVVFGEQTTRWMLYGLDIVLIAGVTVAFYAKILSLIPTVAILGGLGYGVVLVACIGRLERYDWLSIACEVKHIFVFTGVLLLTQISV